MTQYFEVESDNFLDFGVTKSPKLGSQSILGGRIIKQDLLPPLVYEIDFPNDVELPHFLTGGTVLASQRLINLLRSQGVENFQAFHAELLNPDTGKKWSQYYLFNVIGLIKAANMDKSDYDELMPASPDGINIPLVAFNKISIDKSKTRDTLMFRLAEDPTVLIVHEKIVDALDDNRPEEGWGIDVIELESV